MIISQIPKRINISNINNFLDSSFNKKGINIIDINGMLSECASLITVTRIDERDI